MLEYELKPAVEADTAEAKPKSHVKRRADAKAKSSHDAVVIDALGTKIRATDKIRNLVVTVLIVAIAGFVACVKYGLFTQPSKAAGAAEPTATASTPSLGSVAPTTSPSAITVSPSAVGAGPAGALATTAGNSDVSPSSGAGSAATTTTGSATTATVCRTHTPQDLGGAHFAAANPCISASDNGKVSIYSTFVAEKTGHYTLFVWLADGSGAADANVFRACPVDFEDVGQHQSCALGNIAPPRAGSWQAVAYAEAGSDASPSIWGSKYTGMQSGALMWSPSSS